MQQKGVITISVIFGLSFASIMVLVARFLWSHKPSKDHSAPHTFSVSMGKSQLRPTSDRHWARVFTVKQTKSQLVPSLSDILKAGDEGVYSSAFFDDLAGLHGELSLEAVLETFANEKKSRLPKRRPVQAPLLDFVTNAPPHIRRSLSTKANKQTRRDLPPRQQGNSIDLAERGLQRAQTKKEKPTLISAFNPLPRAVGSDDVTGAPWLNDMQQAQSFDGKIGLTVTSTELAALSMILGSPPTPPLTTASTEQLKSHMSTFGNGALGFSIHSASLEHGKHRVFLKRHKRSVVQQPARGSGYSWLLAKHLASGSLPYLQDEHTVNTILVTNETYDAIRSGNKLQVQACSMDNNALRFLSSLPNSKTLNFFTLTDANTSTPPPQFLHAIAGLPFSGGFTPLASASLVKTVRFVASAGLPPARLLQRLEALVEKVQHSFPSLNLFGPLLEDRNAGLLFREQRRLGRLATGDITTESITHKSSRMRRYTTLLECLMGMVPGMKTHEVLGAVREATKEEMERSYEEAVVACAKGDSQTSEPTSKRLSAVSTRARHSLASSKSSAPTSDIDHHPSTPTTPTSVNSSRQSTTFPVNNLGRQVEGILKSSLPFDISTIALLARLLLVAWTLSVESVAWEEGEEGIRYPDLASFPEKMVMW